MRNFRSYALVAVVVVFLLMVGGCWIPEDFNAEIQVNKDGSSLVKFDGTLMFARALAELKGGSLARKDEDDIKMVVEQMRQLPGVKNATYLGKGRCKVSVEKRVSPGESYVFLSGESQIFAILPQKDGTLKISAVQPSPKDIETLKTIGAKTAGKLKISVAKGVEVLQDNASSKGKGSGSFSNYQWKIDSVEANPMILLRPAS